MIGTLATVIGLATLTVLLDRSGSLVAAVLQIAGLSNAIMALPKIVKVTAEESAAIYKRTRSADNVEEYVEMLRAENFTTVGATFKMALETVVITPPTGSDDMTPYEADILAGTQDPDDEPDGITVRAAKRRFNAAAKVLGLSIKWKESKGWLVARATSGAVETSTEAADTEADDSADVEAAAEAQAEADAADDDTDDEELDDEEPTVTTTLESAPPVTRRRRR
jgi:hypothetical protein